MRTSVLPLVLAVTASASSFGADLEFIINGRGSVPLYLPESYDGSEPLPLIIGLHGYTQTGPELDADFNLSAQVDARKFLCLIPDGTTDFFGSPFWNATDACCNFFNSGVDDSGYLRELIELVQAEYNVDAASIHVTGLSNGGFMSYRMACDHADLVASIAPVAGSTFLDPGDCLPSEAVHVLHVHGTADSTIAYDGGCIFFSCFPGAEDAVQQWVTANGCSATGTTNDVAFNLDWSVGGNETTSIVYEQDCDDGVTVERWRLAGSEHVPAFRRGGDPLTANLFGNRGVEWLLAHRKPSVLPCPTDVNSDGVVSADDVLDLLERWGSADSATDLDESGTVDIDDLLILLKDFGRVC